MYYTVGCCLQLPLVNGFFDWFLADFFCVPHNSSCIKQSLKVMSTPGNCTQELNMEGQKTVAPMVAQPCLEDKKVKDDPVVAPVVSGLSAIGLEPGTKENPDMAPVVAPPPQAIPAQQMNPKLFMWMTAKPLFLLNMKEYREANERMICDLENRDRDDEDYNKFHHQMFGDN
jgi:hypothetical protein